MIQLAHPQFSLMIEEESSARTQRELRSSEPADWANPSERLHRPIPFSNQADGSPRQGGMFGLRRPVTSRISSQALWSLKTDLSTEPKLGVGKMNDCLDTRVE